MFKVLRLLDNKAGYTKFPQKKHLCDMHFLDYLKAFDSSSTSSNSIRRANGYDPDQA